MLQTLRSVDLEHSLKLKTLGSSMGYDPGVLSYARRYCYFKDLLNVWLPCIRVSDQSHP